MQHRVALTLTGTPVAFTLKDVVAFSLTNQKENAKLIPLSFPIPATERGC